VLRESPTAVQTAYESGRGVHRDYKQAHTWYRKAADQNLSGAEKEVGYFYQSGLGVKRDYAQALTWYRRAAGHGNSDAENQLGWMYQFGQGIELDDLTDRGEAVWQFANSPVSDAAMAQAQRRTNIQDLHRRINEVEADALHQDDLVDQFEHNGKGFGITKIINAMGNGGAVPYRSRNLSRRSCAPA
jgi:TPR repeat protein